jgi:tRNA 2-thiouridine synthesizing protein E
VLPKKEFMNEMSMLLQKPNLVLERDDEGFLLRTETWTKDIATLLAKGEVLEGLTEDHWKVIDYLRKYYVEFKSVHSEIV